MLTLFFVFRVDFCEPDGEVIDADFPVDDAGQSKGFCYVTFATKKAAKKLILFTLFLVFCGLKSQAIMQFFSCLKFCPPSAR